MGRGASLGFHKGELVEFLLLLWIATSFLVAYIAKEKYRDYWVWWAISLGFSPLLALLALCALPLGEAPKAAPKANGIHPVDCACRECAEYSRSI